MRRIGRHAINVLLCLGIVCSAELNAQTPFICDGRFYMTQVFQTNSALVEVDIDPQTEEVVFNTINANLGTVINGIGYRAEENLIYAVHPSDHFLFRLDANGNIENLTLLNLTPGYFYLGADITPDGRFLVLVGSTDVNGLPVDAELSYVDLEDPNYNVTVVPLQGAIVNMLDVAFDPETDIMYGFDSAGDRLVIVEADGTVTTPFPASDQLDNAGSLFFDVFGDLYAYGSPTGGLQTTLYAINKQTGEFRPLTTGAAARATDACSCPFSVEVRKLVAPESRIPCGIVRYSFAISNLSNRVQDGITFEDLMPAGWEILEIITNPFGGTLQSGPGTDFLQYTDLAIPPGVDTLVVEVLVGDVPPGEYKNQAFLFGLPPGLGESRFSDDPRTLAKRDSTTLIIDPNPPDTLILDTKVCLGGSTFLDPSIYGNEFAWSDGVTGAPREITTAGTYSVEARTPCDTTTIIYRVEESSIDVNVDADATEILLGESVQLSSEVFNSGIEVFYNWTDPFERGSLSCIECPDPVALPFDSSTYVLTVTNEDGCTASASVALNVDFTRTFYAPNVFSPNGDGVNDIFYLLGFGLGQIEQFEIFNRWGGLVFSSPQGVINDPSIGWDGTVNGQLAEPAVFAWVARISYLDGTEMIYSGDVTLLR